MAVELTFTGTEKSKTNQEELKLFASVNNELFIQIEGNGLAFICLDKSTAIKLSKELRKQIALLD